LRVQQNGFDLLKQQRYIILREGQRLTKIRQFCGPLLLILKRIFVDGFAKLDTELIQILLANSHNLLTEVLHLATADKRERPPEGTRMRGGSSDRPSTAGEAGRVSKRRQESLEKHAGGTKLGARDAGEDAQVWEKGFKHC
jgi:hypothetical protein